jgi:hypothetical protein
MAVGLVPHPHPALACPAAHELDGLAEQQLGAQFGGMPGLGPHIQQRQ